MRRALAMRAWPAALLAVVALLACAYASETAGLLPHHVPAMAYSAFDSDPVARPTDTTADEPASGREAVGDGGGSEARAADLDSCAEGSGHCLVRAAQPKSSIAVDTPSASATALVPARPGPATPPTAAPRTPLTPDLCLLCVSRT
ncbi:hypothetical protein [Streptomyces mayteni]